MEEQAVVPDAADILLRRHAWLAGGGEMGRLLRSMDWSQTPLGPMDTWPPSLRTTVSLVMESNFPIALTWGPGHIQIYNDGYWPLCGDKHPMSMGSDFRECWASAWPAIGEAYASALAGQPAYLEDQRMFLDRHGYLEETFFTFSFSPIRDDTGQVVGLFHPTTETTARILGQRRTRTLRDLMTRATEARTVDESLHLVAQTLADAELDLPFVLLYRLDEAQTTARLIAHTGLPANTPASPAAQNLLEASADAGNAWPLRQAAATRHPVLVTDLPQRFGTLYCGPYPEALSSALVLPLRMPGQDRTTAVMVAGISSRLPLNESYRAFYDLLAAGVSVAMAHADAYDIEHLRAESLADVARSKADFLARMSHEIRTPMNAVIGMTTLLQDTTLNTEQHDYVETIRTGGEHLLTIINDILDLSKIEAGKLELDSHPFDLRECLEGALDLVSVRAAQKGLELLLLIDDGVPQRVLGDAGRLRQILINLVDNGVKFTPRGEVTVKVVAEGAAPDGEQALSVTVRDTGVGITADRMERLFRAFAQADSSITRLYGGTGLGLAISKRLAQMMGGDIEVASRPGEGTVFTVRLRLRVAAASRPTQVPQELCGRRVLVVDDNATNCLILDRFLHNWQVRTQVCDSGEAALKLLEAGEQFDLAMLDHHMPNMDGTQLARAIRLLPDGGHMPLVLLSSVTERDAGGDFDVSLPKPVKPAQLFETLQRALTDTRQPNAAAVHPDVGMGREQPLRLLVAEDNAVNSRVIRLLLEKLGYSADIVANGLEALQAIERQRYDAVLMDLLMPDMDGLAATRAIAQRVPNKRQRPYVIGLSAHAMEDARQSCLDAGMDDYLAKPVIFDQLKQTLQRCWDRRHGALPPVAPQDLPVDQAVLLQLSELIGEKEVRELIDIYLVSTPRLLTEAVLAARRRDAEAVSRVFHEIKSTSAALGANRIRHLCEKLEAERRRGHVYALERHVAAVHDAFDLVRTGLQDYGSHIGLTAPGLPSAGAPPLRH
ncbi:MAG: response regulator [Aquabacterium sp.]|nr:MAG: response regulator [Aquabacterium sp.]